MPPPCPLCGAPAATPAGYCGACAERGVPAADDVHPCAEPLPPELLPKGARIACEPCPEAFDLDETEW